MRNIRTISTGWAELEVGINVRRVFIVTHMHPRTVRCRKTFGARPDRAAADRRIVRTLADPRKARKPPTTATRKPKIPIVYGRDDRLLHQMIARDEGRVGRAHLPPHRRHRRHRGPVSGPRGAQDEFTLAATAQRTSVPQRQSRRSQSSGWQRTA
jgi:hypothetical protein